MKYCLDCEWAVVDPDPRPETDSSERAIDHVQETGHSISSDDSPALPPLRAEIGPALSTLFRALAQAQESNGDR